MIPVDTSRVYFIALLRDFLREEPPRSKPESASWREVKRLSVMHSTAGMVGFMVRQLPEDQRPEAAVYRFFCESFFATVQQTARKVYLYEQLMRRLDEEKIAHMAVKGVVIRNCYAQPELRDFGDIDLLIQRDDFARLDGLMRRLGYAVTVEKENESTYVKDGEYYEMHLDLLEVSLNDFADQSAFFHSAWENARPFGDGCAYELNREYHFIYLIAHLAKHVCYGGAGVRLFLDIAAYVWHYQEMDWEKVWTWLDQLRLSTFARHVFYICFRFFELPQPGDPFEMPEASYAVFCDYILSAGTFGLYRGANAAESEVRRQAASAGSLERAKRSAARSYLFPSYENMRVNYPFVDGRPLLLPAAWAVRFLKVFSEKGRKASGHLQNISAADNHVEAQRRLFDRLELK